MEKQENKSVLLKLFLSTFYISAFTFGGGFAIISFMKRKFIDELHWLEEQEMLDMTALAQSCPGSIAVNAAILMGWRVAGFPGMLVAVLGTLLPPVLLLSAISFFYSAFATNAYVALLLKGMQAGVAAVIADVACGLGAKVVRSRSALQICLMIAAFLATVWLDVNVLYVILGAAAVGAVYAIVQRKREGRQ